MWNSQIVCVVDIYFSETVSFPCTKRRGRKATVADEQTDAGVSAQRRRLVSASRRAAFHLRGQHSRTNFSHDIAREGEMPHSPANTKKHRAISNDKGNDWKTPRRVATRRLRIFRERASLRAVFQAAMTQSISRNVREK